MNGLLTIAKLPWVFALVAALMATSATMATGRGATDQASVAPTAGNGTGALLVKVVADDGGAVRGARIVVTVAGAETNGSAGQSLGAPAATVRDGGRPSLPAREARTDLGGVVLLPDLASGDYSVTVLPPTSYVAARTPTRVHVNARGQAATTVRLTRGGVVTGRILDENGDPVTGASVSVLRLSRAGGRPQSGNYATQPTNDLGVYRVWNLAPGDYVVGVRFENSQSLSYDGPAVDGYQPTYFPGSLAFDGAGPVQVKAGLDTGAVDIQLIRGRLGSVSGRVIHANGALAAPPPPNASVRLTPRSSSLGSSTRGAGIRPDGTFLIPNVPAGDYFVSTGPLSSASGSTAPREGGFSPVTVSGDDVSTTIEMNRGATVSGRVTVEGIRQTQPAGPGSTGPRGQIRVRPQPAMDGLFSAELLVGDQSDTSGIVRPDGTFMLTGVRGQLHLLAAGGGAVMKEVRRGAQDISGQPLELSGTERIDDVLIVMTYETGQIDAIVEDETSETLEGAAILVVPDDPKTWNLGSPFLRTSRARAVETSATSSGAAAPGVETTAIAQPRSGRVTFQVSALPPGRYLVFVFADEPVGANLDRGAIERLRELGVVATVEAGQTATLKVPAIR